MMQMHHLSYSGDVTTFIFEVRNDKLQLSPELNSWWQCVGQFSLFGVSRIRYHLQLDFVTSRLYDDSDLCGEETEQEL